MKKIWLISLLVIALMLGACADGGVEQTPGALGTEPVLGTETGLGTDTGLGTPVGTADTEPTLEATIEVTMEATAAATNEATAAATSDAAGTPEGQVTAAVDTGIVAVPYSLFTVASVTGDTGAGQVNTDATPMAVTPEAGTPMATAAAGTQAAGEIEGDTLLVRASEVLGSEIVDMNGDTVGNVSDVLVNETGAIQYVVVDAGTYLEDMGTEAGTGTDAGTPAAGTPEPIGTLDNSTQVVGTIEPAGTAAAGTQPADAGTPEAMTTSTVGEGTAVAEPGVMADEDTILIFNGGAEDLQAQAIMLPENLLDADGAMLDVSGGDMPADMAVLNGQLRVSQLTDGNANVLDAQDQDLGEVEDILVDIRQGMLQFGVVDFGGFLGIAENTVAVPWEQFTLNAQTGADAALRLDVTEETLQNAPQLNIGDWPSWPNPIPTDWETETRTFWETAS